MSKKIKVVRASGTPVRAVEEYNAEYRALYDKVLARAGIDMSKVLEEEQAKHLQAVLERADRMYLKKKYPIEEYWEPIKGKKKWLELVDYYGPIMIAKSEGELAYIIFDISV